jgi:hypothetical protein
VASSTNVKPNIVFAQGIWADGSCFNKVGVNVRFLPHTPRKQKLK